MKVVCPKKSLRLPLNSIDAFKKAGYLTRSMTAAAVQCFHSSKLQNLCDIQKADFPSTFSLISDYLGKSRLPIKEDFL